MSAGHQAIYRAQKGRREYWLIGGVGQAQELPTYAADGSLSTL